MRELIHRLLYLMLTEIHTDEKKDESTPLFRLVDLFRLVPLQLEKAEQGDMSYDELLSELRHSAQQKGMERGLENVIRQTIMWHSKDQPFDNLSIIHRVIYHALLDIRMEAYGTQIPRQDYIDKGLSPPGIQNEKAYSLADIFHDAPLALERPYVERGLTMRFSF